MTVLTIALSAAGCSMTVEDLPLPTKGLGGETFSVQAVFVDALNLPAKAPVKLDGTTVGEVEALEVSDFRARATLSIRTDTRVSAAVTAELRQSTPLGDTYIALIPPAEPSTSDVLSPGDVIGVDRTTAGASVEEVLAAASTVLSGGNLAQVQTIVTELNNISGGETPAVSDLVRQISDVATTLNAHAAQFDQALAAAAGASSQLSARNERIADVIGAAAPAMQTLEGKTRELVDTLEAAGRTSDQVHNFVTGTSESLVHLIDQSGVLTGHLAELDSRLASAFAALSQFGQVLAPSIQGDYVASYIRVSSLSVPATYDPGSRWWELADLGLAGASLADTLNRVWVRLTNDDPIVPSEMAPR
ncbi:MCE family protein [Rhodococcus qingshengii]|uniref:MCE family protein n=1 Tax=Rhodococcus qingshengii TaxID=334542 RepID=UPI00365BB8FD